MKHVGEFQMIKWVIFTFLLNINCKRDLYRSGSGMPSNNIGSHKVINEQYKSGGFTCYGSSIWPLRMYKAFERSLLPASEIKEKEQ